MSDKLQQDYSLEQMFEMLEETVGKMETEELSLEETFRLYYKGMELLKNCNDKIDQVEKKILVLDEEGELYEFEA